MPRNKNIKPIQRQYLGNRNNIFELNDGCSKHIQSSETRTELQNDQICDTVSDLIQTNTDLISSPTENNHMNFQADFKLSHDSATNFEEGRIPKIVISITPSVQTQNSLKDMSEFCQNSAVLPENQDFASDNLFSTKVIEPSDYDAKESKDASADTQPDQNNSSDSQLEKAVNIRTKAYDIDSEDAQNCHDHFQNGNGLLIKTESCDINFNSSDPFTSESSCHEHFHSGNELNVKTEPFDSHSDSLTSEDSYHEQFQTENEVFIKNEPGDLHSDLTSESNCHEHLQATNELCIKSELSDLNSDSFRPENSNESKSRTESSNEVGDCELSHSNGSSTMDIKSENPETENLVACPPTQDLKRSRRNSKRKREMEDRCPVCGLTVRYADLESHFAKEVENLSNIPRTLRKYRTPYKEREGFTCGLNIAYAQAKYNREKRLAAKRAKYMTKPGIICPVCKINISGTDEEINGHVLRCFGEDDDSDINITDYDENFEEYEIGNETRIRAISLVHGGHSALHGFSSKSKSTNEDEGIDVNVDVDDTLSFGKPQYTELDVIHNTSSSSNEREEQLRRAVVSDLNAEPHVIESNKWSQNNDIQKDIDEIIGSCTRNRPEEVKLKDDDGKDMKVDKDDSKKEEHFQCSEANIISSLKERIKDLEQQKNVKCLICLEPYTTPLVSTTCWHVHCEECWLVSMGVKKLCPQCNMIVFPTDLRKIYL